MSTVQALSAPQGLSMPTAKKIFAFASMCVGMFIALIDIQIVSASLRDIGGGLSAGDDETVWVQTSYLIAEIIIIPLSGWLARVMSTRWLFAASAAGFTLMSLLCGWAWNIQSMIAFRALQGLAGGSMIPLVFTTAFAFFQGKQRVIAAATIGGLASLAPTLGPTVGGWITENYNWHWLFFINVVPGIYIAVAVPLLVKVDSADPTLLRGADYLSILLLALSLGCLEYTLEEGPRWGWFDDATLTTTAWVALLCGVAFVIRTLRHPQPVMDLRALQDRTFSLGCYFSFMAGVGIFASGSKPCSGSLSMDGTWPATLQGISATSCSLSRVIPDLPASSDCQTCCTPQPSGLTIPIPVTTMRLTETPIVNSPVVSVCRRLFHQGNQQRGK